MLLDMWVIRFSLEYVSTLLKGSLHYPLPHHENPANRNRTSDHLMAAAIYSQMLYQLSYSRLGVIAQGQAIERLFQGGLE